MKIEIRICSSIPSEHASIDFNKAGIIAYQKETHLEFFLGDYYEKNFQEYKQIRILKDITIAKNKISRTLKTLHRKLDNL